jgi:hypothetical protein
LLRETKKKFTAEQSIEYLDYCSKHSLLDSFRSLYQWVGQKLNVVQRAEREFASRAKTTKGVHMQGLESLTNLCQTDNNEQGDDDYEVDVPDSTPTDQEFKDQVNSLSLLFQKQGFFKKSGGVQGEVKPKGAFQATKTLYPKTPYPKPGQPKVDFKTCPLCKGAHAIELCEKFKGLEARRRHGFIKKLNLCFHCLKEPHRVRDCTFAKDRLCGVGGCVRFHHALLHPDSSVNNIGYEDRDSTCSELPDFDFDSESLMHVAAPGSISLQTVVVNLTVGGASKQVIALLDSGSQATCIDEDLASNLKLPVLIGSTKRRVDYADRVAEMDSKLIQFEISSLDGLTTQTLTGWTMKDLASRTGIVDWSREKLKFQHLRSVPFPPLPKPERISILIGTGYPNLYIASKGVSDPANKTAPVALLTPLGWSAVGASSKGNHSSDLISFLSQVDRTNGQELIDTMCLFSPVLMHSKSAEEAH